MSNARGFKTLWMTACMCCAIIANTTWTAKAESAPKSSSASVVSQAGQPMVADAATPVDWAAASGMTPVLADPNRVIPVDLSGIGGEDTEGADPRGGCVTIYNNMLGGTSAYIIVGSDRITADTCTMAGTNRFVCQITVFVGSFGGIPAFPLRVQIWNNTSPFCPNAGAVLFAEDIHLTVAPTFHNEIYAFPDVLIPNTVNIGLVTPVVTAAGSGPAWVITRDFSGAGEIGTSGDVFLEQDPPAPDGCTATAYFFGGAPTLANFGIDIQAGAGPDGACCNQQTAVCTDPTPLGNCLDYFHRWTEGTCAEADPCILCNVIQGTDANPNTIDCNANIVDNEPNCAANYVDTTNSGCAFSPDPNNPNFTNVQCGDRMFGTMGTYTFQNGTVVENRRDNDYYRFTLTSTSRVTWTVTSEAGANAQLFIPVPPGPCNLVGPSGPGDVASGTSGAGCLPAVATACLPPGTYYAVARTPTTVGFPCGIEYCGTLTCVPCDLVDGACCLPTGCVDDPNDPQGRTNAIGCVLAGGVYQGDGTTCGSVTCPAPPDNETCLSRITLTNDTVMVAFDTTFAITESTTTTATCENGPVPMFRDMWWEYRPTVANVPAGVTAGRLVVSTYDSCVDTRVAVYRVSCDPDQTIQCASLEEIGCNDDININRGNFASYVAISDIGGGGPPTVGECFKIRVGTFDETDANRGPGMLRIDFVPVADFPWTPNAGRCCWPDGGCAITTGSASTCEQDGGYFTASYDPTEGDPTLSVINGIGCKTVPCPEIGEACFKPFRLAGPDGQGPELLPGGFGTTTKAVRKRSFFKYQIPFTALPGQGITFSTCGSDFDTVLAIYADGVLDPTSGECIGTPEVTNDDCSPNELTGVTAQGIASCFGGAEVDSCVCVTVGSIPASPFFPGNFIFVEVGAFNSIENSTLATIDPVPENCGTPVLLSLTVTLSAECFACAITCPGGGVPENEPVCAANYVDTTNGGCNSTPNVFTTVTCNSTVCGEAGTYTFLDVTVTQNRRDTDWYRLSVATASTLNLNFNGGFRGTTSIFKLDNPGDPCAGNLFGIASATAGAACEDTPISAAVCPGEYIIIVVPNVFTGIDCGTEYVLTIDCDAAPAQDCCKGDMNNDGRRNGLDVRLFVRNMLAPPIALFPIDGCYNLNTCRADMNGDYAITLADVPGFVNLLLTAADCPAGATCADPAKCHLTTSDGGAVSALSAALGCNQRTTDDFRPSVSGTITTVCWHGFYLNLSGGVVCPDQAGTGDDFRITIFNDNAGVPGGVLSGPHAVVPTKVADGFIPPIGSFGQATQWRYTATIPAVNVTAGTCYWIEIVNNTTGACCWLWSLAGTANNVSASRLGGAAGQANYVAGDLLSGDFAFCLDNIRIDKQDCGLPQGRCCYTQGPTVLCQDSDEPTCLNLIGGTWTLGQNCTNNPCPLLAPDNCADASALTLNVPKDGTTAGLTPSAGLVPSCESTGTGQNTAPDGWYTYTATVTGPHTVSGCADPDPVYDMIMVVYSGACGSLTEVGCSDDECGPVAGDSTVTWNAVNGTTYRIRMTGWHGSSGAFQIVVTQP